MTRLILMDLDETLLRSDKTVSQYTLDVLRRCRSAGILVGFCTARGEANTMLHIDRVHPDVIISSGGALVRCRGEIIHQAQFTREQTRAIIDAAQRLTGGACEITVDTLDTLYWNYREHPGRNFPDWNNIVHTDYTGFSAPSLKITINLPNDHLAEEIAAAAGGCDWFCFVNSRWYKFTLPGATKTDGIRHLTAHLGISLDEIIAFGDDRGDIDMLRSCGTGIAVANAIPDVLAIADAVTDSNDCDGVARYLENHLLS